MIFQSWSQKTSLDYKTNLRLVQKSHESDLIKFSTNSALQGDVIQQRRHLRKTLSH